jgi:hypothetical protein
MSGDLWQTLSRLALIGVIGGLAGACSETGRFAAAPSPTRSRAAPRRASRR